MTVEVSEEAVRAIIESDRTREEKLRELSKLVLGVDKVAMPSELFAAVRGFPLPDENEELPKWYYDV